MPARRAMFASILLSIPALAQTDATSEAAPENPVTAPSAESDAGTPRARRARASTDGGVEVAATPAESGGAIKPADVENVKAVARNYFNALLLSDARAVVKLSAFPFTLETKTFNTPDDLFAEWLRQLRAKRTDLLTLADVEVLTPVEMEKKYGRPPSRLATFPWRSGKTLIAIGNLSGHAAIAVFRAYGPTWRAIAYHD